MIVDENKLSILVTLYDDITAIIKRKAQIYPRKGKDGMYHHVTTDKSTTTLFLAAIVKILDLDYMQNITKEEEKKVIADALFRWSLISNDIANLLYAICLSCEAFDILLERLEKIRNAIVLEIRSLDFSIKIDKSLIDPKYIKSGHSND